MNDENYAWSNYGNNAFYETVKAEGLKKLAEKGGLASGCDMRLLTPYWSHARSILEVGAGYGRVIGYLLKHQFNGNITAIERCSSLFAYLKKRYEKKVKLLPYDIYGCDGINERFDLILFLWGAICDFPPKEQLLIIKKLAKFLEKKGKLIIDTIPSHVAPLGSKKHGQQFYSIEVNKSPIYVYLPSIHEIKRYAEEAGFSNVQHISCQTDNGRERWLFILS